jgi:hypothetical protein
MLLIFVKVINALQCLTAFNRAFTEILMKYKSHLAAFLAFLSRKFPVSTLKK